MKSTREVIQRLNEVDKQIRETAETAVDSVWHNLHIESETLRWVLNVPSETV